MPNIQRLLPIAWPLAALPERVPASYYGVSYAYAINAVNGDGSRQVYFDLECGGWGAHPEGDGANGFSCGFHNIANSPIEMIEGDYPITFTGYGLLPDSGGSGKYRGGLGLFRGFRLDAPMGTFAANLDRFKIPPYGLAGGQPGRGGKLTLTRADGSIEALPSKVAGLALQKGDCLQLETSGGGGHGDPIARSADLIQQDHAAGYVTADR